MSTQRGRAVKDNWPFRIQVMSSLCFRQLQTWVKAESLLKSTPLMLPVTSDLKSEIWARLFLCKTKEIKTTTKCVILKVLSNQDQGSLGWVYWTTKPLVLRISYLHSSKRQSWQECQHFVLKFAKASFNENTHPEISHRDSGSVHSWFVFSKQKLLEESCTHKKKQNHESLIHPFSKFCNESCRKLIKCGSQNSISFTYFSWVLWLQVTILYNGCNRYITNFLWEIPDQLHFYRILIELLAKIQNCPI